MAVMVVMGLCTTMALLERMQLVTELAVAVAVLVYVLTFKVCQAVLAETAPQVSSTFTIKKDL
jgi:hypothetical protein